MPKIYAMTHCNSTGALLVVSADSSAFSNVGPAYLVDATAEVEYPMGFPLEQTASLVRGTYDNVVSAVNALQLELRDMLYKAEQERSSLHEQLGALGRRNLMPSHKVLGVDYHGVISKGHPQLAAAMEDAVSEGHAVHIMTGSRMSPELKDKLHDCGFDLGRNYTDFFSIQDHLDRVGEPIIYDEEGLPHADALAWDMAKSEYALATGMCAVWDDSPVYGRYMPASCWYFTYSPEAVGSQVRMVLDGTRKRIGR